MTTFERCSTCGARVRADLPAGSVCPVCLLGLALEQAGETGTSVPPSPDAGAAPPAPMNAPDLISVTGPGAETAPLSSTSSRGGWRSGA
jgi:hypothetical protein